LSPAIEASGLGKRYGRHVALAGVDLRVDRGEVFGLIGPNGAGKTTTMRLLLDLLRPTSGRLRVLGAEPRAGGPGLRRRIGYLPGELRLARRATGRELLEFYARLRGDTPSGQLQELADRLGADLDRRVGTLSKGNRQKLGLVQAFMGAPDLLILDEPTSGLDPLLQQEFLRLVREAHEAGRTVFLSSHVLSEVQQVAGRVGLLAGGRLTHVESVAALRAAAPRRVRLTLPAVEAERALPALRALEGLEGATVLAAEVPGSQVVEARYVGAPAPLLALLAGLPATDVVLAEPDLEEAVIRLYGAPGRREPT
jgi:ABC-2 type transport system ATP-binding protein